MTTRKIVLILISISSFFSLIIISVLWLGVELNFHKKEKISLLENSILEQKEALKKEVLQVKHYIDFKKQSSINTPDSIIQNEILNYISTIRFGNDGYIFINTFSGYALVHDGKLVQGKKDVRFMTDPEGKNIFEMQVEVANKPGGGFIEYKFKKMTDTIAQAKLSYINSYQEWQWTIGAGDYLDNLESRIAIREHELLEVTRYKIAIIIIAIILIFILLIFYGAWISKKISEQYQVLISYIKSDENKQLELFHKLKINEYKDIGLDLRNANLQTKQFANMIDKSLNEFYILDAETLKFIYSNDAAEKNIGYSFEELSKLTHADITPDIESVEFNRIIKPLKSGEKPKIVFETIYQRKDKSKYPVEVHIQQTTFDREEAFIAIILDLSDRKEIEKSLKESEEKFRNLVTSMNDMVFVFDKNKNISYYHTQDISELYTEPELFIGKKVSEFMPPYVTIKFDEAFSKAQKNESYAFDYQLEVKNEKKWFSLQLSPMFKENEFDGALAIIREITELKRAEQQIKEKGQFIESIVNLSPNILYIYDINKQKNVYSNNGIERILGYPSSEIVQMDDDFFNIIMHPEDLKIYLEETYPKILNAKEGEIIHNQHRMKHKLGHWCWLDCFEIIYLRNSDSVPTQILGVVYDITETKNSEEELKKVTQLLKETGKIAKIGGWEFDTETGAGTWTEEVSRIYDLDPNEPTNVKIGLSFYTKESKIRIEKAIENAITNKQSYNLELELNSAKGVRKWVRTIGNPVVVNNKVVSVGGSFQDITNEKNSEMELQKHKVHLEDLVIERTEELAATLNDVERMNKLFIGREMRIKDLRDKIKELENKLK